MSLSIGGLASAAFGHIPLDSNPNLQSSTVKSSCVDAFLARRNQAGGRRGIRMYRELNVVSSYARQQENRSAGYHGYHSTEPQGVSVVFGSYSTVPTGTTNAAAVSLDSIWTPRRHFLRVTGERAVPTSL